MPQNGETPITSEWSMITPDNVTSLTFQNNNNFEIRIWGTVGTTPPSGIMGLVYPPLFGESNVAMTDLFPGLTGANRLWARVSTIGQTGVVFRSYA